MGFKDAVKRDLDAFLNLDEFGEIHNVDGKDVTIIIDYDATKERPRQPSELYHDAAGVYIYDLLIFVRDADLDERPVISQHLRLDGQLHLVKDCTENFGLLAITLGVNEA